MTVQRLMKVACIIGFVSIYSFNSEARSRSRVDRAAVALQAPLIIGASVSSGFLSESPGERAARHYGYTGATNIARIGSSGRESTNINPDNLRGYTSVIGVDFLFWDSTGGDTRSSLMSLRNLIASAHEARVPLVLGDIPQLRVNQPAREVLNRAIRSQCRAARGCHVVPLARLHEVASTRGVEFEGRLYHYQDLTIDGLHVNEVGSELISQMIIAALRR